MPLIIATYNRYFIDIMFRYPPSQTHNQQAMPYRVVIIGFDEALSSSITGALDMFALAGVAWQRIHKQAIQPVFKTHLASHQGEPITCINQVQLMPHLTLDEIDYADIVMLPTIGGDITKVLEQTRGILPHLIRLHKNGCDLVSNCTGAFLLANAGLLDNKTATTHWGYADQFQSLFPKVDLHTNELITEDSGIFCAGGGMAWFDLVLRLIERYCDHQTAVDTAKAHVVDFARGQQAAYAPLQRRKFHHDQDVLTLQDWLETHYAKSIDIEQMATFINVSSRSLIRRFKRATHQTPQQYLQTLRIDNAKRLLISSDMSIHQVVQDVGYEDISSFTRLFKRITGFSPGHYRKSFRGR